MSFSRFEQYWPFYLSQHSKPATRMWHAVGMTSALLFILTAIWTMNGWYLLLAPGTAYPLAWFSHFVIEGNKPSAYGHPLWLLRAELRMYRFMLSGKMDEELRRVSEEIELL
ncbi:DUF962 domain-containing protein [Paenibacillus turpanensis]|uniref:DUF962 domain-containing protein n=1 Tax=Paenibacillus turpanensis TaxID=2689078 RepID=UPI00140873A9|nr:DUF962 domain-containing protein [Paenibacillus turpanensis]